MDISIGASGGGGGSASDSFKTIAVAGQSDVVADSSTDTLTLVAGTGIVITTDATTDTITVTGSVTQYTDEMAQDAVGSVVGHGLVYDDPTGAISVSEAALDHNTIGGKQGGTLGEYYHLTAAQATVVSNTSGTNTGDQTITLTGDVTGSGTGSFAATIANDAVTYAKMQNVSATSRVLGRISAGAGDVEELTGANLATILGGSAGSNTQVLFNDSGVVVGDVDLTWNKTTNALTIGNSGYLDTAGGWYMGGTTKPGNIEITRTLGGTSGDYVEVGSFSVTNGSNNIRLSVTVNGGGHSIAKQYVIATKYNQTGGNWHKAIPTTDSGFFNQDFAVAVNSSGESLAVRLVTTANGNPDTHYIRIEMVGITTGTFTASSGTGTMSLPTDVLASNTDWHGKSLYLSRTIPTTVGDYVEIGYFTINNGAHSVKIAMTNSDNSFTVSKEYIISSAYAATSDWVLVNPITSSGDFSGNDYFLVAQENSTSLLFRLLRTGGTTSGTAQIAIQYDGDPVSATWVEQSGTGSMTVPTLFHPATMLTQVDGFVGIGTYAPEVKLHVRAAEGLDAAICLDADEGDDNADSWFIRSTASDNDLDFINHTTTLATLTSGGNFSVAGDITIADAKNIALNTTTGTKIGTGTTQKLGFFGVTPVVQQAALTAGLTAITCSAPATPDYDLTATEAGWGLRTEDEMNTLVSVIINLQTKVEELETRLETFGLIST